MSTERRLLDLPAGRPAPAATAAGRPRVLIVGAGIGGLTAALGLARRGHDVRVFEQAARLGEVGAGLQLSANATRALWQLGLAEAIMAQACEPAGKQVRLWNTGRCWKLFDLGAESTATYGYPYLTMYRPDLHAALVAALEAVAPGAVHLGARVDAFEAGERGVALTLDDGHCIEGDVLIGADGVHSQVRRQLFGDAEATFSGCIAWRGVVRASTLPERLLAPVGCNWIGPGRHVIHYPLHGGELLNFVGVVERADWQVESWTQRGSHAECHADFEGWHDDVHALIDHIAVPYKWALFSRAPLPHWSRGRVTLLGDACHPTLPFLAQGAAMAIEDGYVLARAVAAHPGDVPLALQRYEAARLERTSTIVQRSTEAGHRFHNPALASAEGAAAYVDREWSEDKVRERYEWLFRYDVDGVAL